MTDTAVPPPQVDESQRLRWYQGVPRYAWIVFIIAVLGWLLDCMDQNLFNLVRQPSVRDLLEHTGLTGKALDDAVKVNGGYITSIFLIGWAVGGFTFGVLGDKLGRTRTMMITILIYAIFTGLSAASQNIPQYMLFRFLTALGVGGEFAAGASLVAEVWPERSRPMALGTLQALSAVGNASAAVITYLLSNMGWRWVYIIGAAPAILVVWIRSSVKEPEKWHKAREAAEADGTRKELGNMGELFRDPILRRNTIAGVLIAAAGVGGLWGVGFFLPDLTGTVLKPLVASLPKPEADARLAEWRSIVFLIQQAGAFLGMLSYAAFSERVGRRPALLLFLVLAWASIEGTFWFVNDYNSARLWAFIMGYCALAPFAAYAVYFPELYPTRLRATGVGFCYNCARILAAGAPFALGGLSLMFARPDDPTFGFRAAASVVACIYIVGILALLIAPETKGKPLPE